MDRICSYYPEHPANPCSQFPPPIPSIPLSRQKLRFLPSQSTKHPLFRKPAPSPRAVSAARPNTFTPLHLGPTHCNTLG